MPTAVKTKRTFTRVSKQHDSRLVLEPLSLFPKKAPKKHQKTLHSSRAFLAGVLHPVVLQPSETSVPVTGSVSHLGRNSPPQGVNEMTEHKLMTTSELADFLRTTPAAIRMRISRGEIPRSAIIQHKERGRMLFRRSSIEKLFQVNEKGGAR